MVLAPLQLPQIWKRRPAGEARLRPDEALTFSRHDKETHMHVLYALTGIVVLI
jgi:hypothetical protein